MLANMRAHATMETSYTSPTGGLEHIFFRGNKSDGADSPVFCPPLPTYILLHGYQLGVHALLLSLHHLDVSQ